MRRARCAGCSIAAGQWVPRAAVRTYAQATASKASAAELCVHLQGPYNAKGACRACLSPCDVFPLCRTHSGLPRERVTRARQPRSATRRRRRRFAYHSAAASTELRQPGSQEGQLQGACLVLAPRPLPCLAWLPRQAELAAKKAEAKRLADAEMEDLAKSRAKEAKAGSQKVMHVSCGRRRVQQVAELARVWRW